MQATLSPRDKLLLSYADNGLVLNHRLCEWCAHAPSLELEMGLANIGLDHLGQARLWLAPVAARHDESEDHFAYFRDEDAYFNLLLVEQQNGDFAHTIARHFLYDHYHARLLDALAENADSEVRAIADKARLEAAYHTKFSTHWMRVLAGGTAESHQRMREAVGFLWQFCGELFTPTGYEKQHYDDWGIAPAALKAAWCAEVLPLLAPLNLTLDDNLSFHNPSGKENHHSEQLGYLLAEMQVLARKHPGVRW